MKVETISRINNVVLLLGKPVVFRYLIKRGVLCPLSNNFNRRELQEIQLN